MTSGAFVGPLSRWRERPVAVLLRSAALWLILAAVVVAMTTPRVGLAGIRLTVGDVLGTIGCGFWLASLPFSADRPIAWRAARWPVVVLVVALASVLASGGSRAGLLGVVELCALWCLPALTLPNVIESADGVELVLRAVLIGSLLAATSNLIVAARIGFSDGVPVVWGPVDYFQGYFQVLGLAVAAPRLVVALGEGRGRAALGWTIAVVLNVSALLLTQTRGAWVAAALVVGLFAVLWRRGALLAFVVALVAGIIAALSPDFAAAAWGRVQSIFTFDARLFGFESSIGRLGLVITAWGMFVSHPWLGIGLKNFTNALPAYAPEGMPLDIEMGPNHVLTPIEGPHSTYLSLLAQTGLFGALALVAWVINGAWRQYRALRAVGARGRASSPQAVTLLAAVAVVAVYNFFSELNETGALPLVYLLILATCSAMGDRQEKLRA